MTDDEKLQMWQLGAVFNNIPDYLNDDAAAMSLLDTLVEKGFYLLLEYKLFRGIEQWILQIWRQEKHGARWEHFFVCEAGAKTRREAVVATVLELIGKEIIR